MYVGTFTSGNLGVSFYSNDFSTALAAQTTIDWYAPVVTIQMVLDVANFDKIDGFKEAILCDFQNPPPIL